MHFTYVQQQRYQAETVSHTNTNDSSKLYTLSAGKSRQHVNAAVLSQLCPASNVTL